MKKVDWILSGIWIDHFHASVTYVMGQSLPSYFIQIELNMIFFIRLIWILILANNFLCTPIVASFELSARL